MENISLYIHIPFCVSKCKYCDFFSVTTKNCNNNYISEEYVSALCNEIIYRCKNVTSFKSIYIGGGTPSLLTIKQLSKILDTVNKISPVINISEITIELNPDDVTEKLIKSYLEIGITRLSVGIQSMTDSVLSFAGRRANRENNIRALEIIKNNWNKKLSLDIISGLPEETEESFEKSLKEILSYNPDHISMYSLTIEENTPFGEMLETETLAYDFDFADKLWLNGREILERNEYFQYEVSNFSKSGFECIHNLTYWNHEDYIGAGSGATGTVYPTRWTNKKNIEEYIKYWNQEELSEKHNPQEIENIDGDISKFEFFMMGLRKLSGISSLHYKKIFKENIPEKILKVFKQWETKGLLEIVDNNEDTIYKLNKKGILFLNNLLEQIIF